MESTTEVPTISTAIEKIKIGDDVKTLMKEKFEPFERQAAEWKEKALAIVVTSADDKETINGANKARLAIRRIRLDVEKLHEELKEESLRRGQVLDTIKRTLLELLKPIESHLKEQEDFVKREEQKKRDELQNLRLQAIEPYRTDGDGFEKLPLADMGEDAFQLMLNGMKMAKEQREHEAAEAKRIKEENERLAAEENARIRAENERLKKEQEHNDKIWNRQRVLINNGCTEETIPGGSSIVGYFMEDLAHMKYNRSSRWVLSRPEIENMSDEQFKKAFEEMKAIWQENNRVIRLQEEQELNRMAEQNAKLEAERAERKRLEKEAEDRRIKEANDKKQKELDDRRARRAPDKVKLLAMAEQITLIQKPELKEDESKEILNNVMVLLGKVHKYINDQCANL